MRALTLVALFVGLSAGGAPARADMPTPPRPAWGTPGPRSIPTTAGRRPTPLPRIDHVGSWGGPEPRESPAEELRDPTVTMRSERVTLTFLRSLVWVRSTILVRAAETEVAGWPMGMSDHQGRRPGRPVFALEVRAGGEALPIRYRTMPSGDSGESRGYDGWFEWRVDVPADRDTRVDIEYVAPAEWFPANASDQPTGAIVDDRHGFVQAFEYDLALGRRYRDGRGRSRVSARVAGYRARLRRVRDGARAEELGDHGAFEIDEGEDRVRLFVVWPAADPPARPSRSGGEIPAWLALLDRWLFAFPFAPAQGRPTAAQLGADDFALMVEELRERAEHGRGREREVARGLLAAARARLADAVADPWDGFDRPSSGAGAPIHDAGPLPSPDQIGTFGGRLDHEDWLEAIQSARGWLLPSGERLEALTEAQRADPEQPEWLADPDEAAPLAGDLGAAQLPRLQATDRLHAPSLYDGARELGIGWGPPFGLPNQLVVASRRREGPMTWVLLAALGALGAGASFVVRRRRARRAQCSPAPDG